MNLTQAKKIKKEAFKTFGNTSTIEKFHTYSESEGVLDSTIEVLGFGTFLEDENNYKLRMYYSGFGDVNSLVFKVLKSLEIPKDEFEVISVDAFYTLNNLRTKRRPAFPGLSVSHHMVSAGTLGWFASDNVKNNYILSNNHVLANSNQAQIGDIIYQPGVADGGTFNNVIATLAKFKPINFRGNNLIDAAIAKIDPLQVGRIGLNGRPLSLTGISKPRQGMRVFKIGRTTGVTHGYISSTDADVIVNFPFNLRASFLDQIEIRGNDGRPFSAGGDSGSLIIEVGTNKAIGLLFAGNGTITLANPIQKVLTTLNVGLLL